MSTYTLTRGNRDAAAVVARAIAAQLEVNQANAPTTRSNAAILRANNRIRRLLESETLTDERRTELRAQIRDTSPLPHRLDDHTASVLRFAERQRASLKSLTPEAWQWLVETIPLPLRFNVACVVWWDFFSRRISSKAWHHIDEYISEPPAPVPDDELAAALIAVGYDGDRSAGGRVLRVRCHSDLEQGWKGGTDERSA